MKQETFTWPFARRNLIVFAAALVVILLGYVFLSIGPYDSFWSLTAGPVLLVIGYLFLLPAAILVRGKPERAG